MCEQTDPDHCNEVRTPADPRDRPTRRWLRDASRRDGWRRTDQGPKALRDDATSSHLPCRRRWPLTFHCHGRTRSARPLRLRVAHPFTGPPHSRSPLASEQVRSRSPQPESIHARRCCRLERSTRDHGSSASCVPHMQTRSIQPPVGRAGRDGRRQPPPRRAEGEVRKRRRPDPSGL